MAKGKKHYSGKELIRRRQIERQQAAWQNYSRTWKDCQQAQRLQCSVFIFQKHRNNQ